MNNGDDIRPSFEEFFKGLNASWTKAEKKMVQELEKMICGLDPIQSAAVFCGLSTVGRLQSNHIRISNLIHATLKFSNGTKQITKKLISLLFKLVEDSSIGRHEDPAEDVFIAKACTKRGTYQIFEGNWEGSTFFLERFIDIVDGMPSGERYEVTKRSVHALLHLSDIVANNSEVEANIVAAQYPESNIPQEALLPLGQLRQRVMFSEDELKPYGFSIEDISPFIFDISIAKDLPFPSHQSLTDLDKHPILDAGYGKYFLFPQGVSTAIRSLIISLYTINNEDRDALTTNLINSYCDTFQKYQILGALRSPPVSAFTPIRCGDVFIQEFIIGVSIRRPLHLVILFDGFYGDLNDWATSTPAIIGDEEIELTKRIENAKKSVCERSEIKHGITLLVSAGWGRSKGFGLNFQDTGDWSLRHIGAHDLCHLSDHPKMKPLNLWRIIEAEKTFLSLDGRIENINGMLNLFGWLVENKWHIVPHEQMPQEDLPSGMIMTIPTNNIADVRMASRKSKDRIMVPGSDGVPKAVIRYFGSSFFKEDEHKPLYGCFESVMRGKLAAVYLGNSALWWCHVDELNKNERDFQIWKVAISWLERIDQAVSEIGLKIPTAIEWHLRIESLKERIDSAEQFSSSSEKLAKILTTIRICPDGLLNRADNTGEVALVKSFLSDLLIDINADVVDDLIKIIFPTRDAKHGHFFYGRTFNDYVASNLPPPILLMEADDANLRLGLGWLDGTKGKFLKIKGVEACVKHLNGVVDKVWNEIEKELRQYDKVNLCSKLLLNIETIRREKTIWKRTIRACLALHEDKDDVIDVASREISKFNAASLGCRLLIEMVVCTCPDGAHAEPDELDISILLGFALLIFHLGAWSDAIRNNLYPPEIHISSFGQVMLDYEFEKSILIPYHSMFSRQQRELDAEEYEKLYVDPFDSRKVEDLFPTDYLFAYEKEFHISANLMRKTIDALEDLGISERGAVFTIRRSELIEYLKSYNEDFINQNLMRFLSKISLPTRSRWDQTKSLPDDMKPQDWYPWNFRRKLSLVSKPIIELDCSEDPLLLISPGCVREGVWYLLSNSLNATLDERHFDSNEMKKWIGDRRNHLGKKFNGKVAQKLIDLGWESESDVLVTKLLNCKTELDYGDIDVLAWSKDLGVVIAAECKDLYFAKTHKEIGNQINEFLGEIDTNGKRDRLRKHFDRLNVLAANISALSNYVGIEGLSQVHGILVFSQRNVVEYAPQIPRDRIHVCAVEMLDEPEKLIPNLIPWCPN